MKNFMSIILKTILLLVFFLIKRNKDYKSERDNKYIENIEFDGINNKMIESDGKIIVSNIEELLERYGQKSEIKKIEIAKTEETSEFKEEKNCGYKLPEINMIKNKHLQDHLKKNKSCRELMIPLGMNENTIFSESLQSMPNLLVGGTVMSGKSSFVHTIINMILMTKKPDEVKLIIFDSKKIEYSQYNGIPHLLIPIVSNINKCEIALKKICVEIEHRFQILQEFNVKDLTQYNNSLPKEKHKFPDLIIILDDYDTFGLSKISNDSLEMITRLGWNVNVYVILVSNHPSTKVMSTISKSNIPARLCFKVPAAHDSIVILGDRGANKLSGVGKALYKSILTPDFKEVKVEIVSEEESKIIADYIITQQKACYDETLLMDEEESKATSMVDDKDDYEEPLYNEIVEFVVTQGKASASLLQRRFRLGYNRAARCIDLLEERGIIGPNNGIQPREVLIKLKDNNKQNSFDDFI